MATEAPSSKTRVPSPREFLRARRPERFSDSVREVAPVLDASMLEFFLSRITTSSKEVQFETFARKLAQHQICPNLLPHTGPTGGGDSKVDSETYPVSPQLASSWYVGTPAEASSERWAFAMSAKEDWRAKVRKDVEGIAETDRGYTRAYFISSRPIRDKDRAAVEDELTKQYGFSVRLLDANWIVQQVFENHRENLAIEELGLSPELRPRIRKGPNDTAREQDLEEVEKRIDQAGRDGNFSIAMVSDAIAAAVLARSLDLGRTEVDGRFLRARRLAKEHGTAHQRFLAVYQHAWATYWWFEDFPTFLELHDEAAALAQGTENVRELELLVNLWNVLQVSVAHGTLQPAPDLASRRTTLEVELRRLAADTARPSTSLQARTHLILIDLPVAAATGTNLSNLFGQLEEVVRVSEKHVGFPFEPILELVTLLGDLIDADPAFEHLFEAIINVSARRDGERKTGQLLLTRGRQHLQSDRHYEAIRVLGRALGLLYKHESQNHAIDALHLCGLAYEQAGLLWAARGSFLVAASLASSRFTTYSEVTPPQALAYARMKWTELRLGRVGHVLAWHEVDRITRHVLASKGYDPERLFDPDDNFDAVLGLLLLRTDIDALRRLEQLPDALAGLDLNFARIALLYALGHEKEVPPELVEGGGHDEPLRSFFARWHHQPAAEDISEVVRLDDQPLYLESKVLGCLFRAEVENESACVALAESLLAATEALLATGLREGIFAREPSVAITIRRGDSAGAPFAATFDDNDGRLRLDIRCGVSDPHGCSPEVQTAVKDGLQDLLVQLLGRVFWLREVKETLRALLGEQRALDRAVNFTGSYVVLGNVLGSTPRTAVADWCTGTTFPLRRSSRWDSSLPAPPPSPKRPFKMGTGEPPPELRDADSVSHASIETRSVIRLPLWQKAKWRAVAHMVPPELDTPPALVLGFTDREAAQGIFAGLLEDVGPDDPRNELRVTIVRGIDRAHPSHYRVVVGTNIETYVRGRGAGRVVMLSRSLDVAQSSDSSLALFLSRYERLGRYVLIPAVLLADRVGTCEILPERVIEKRDLSVREAWTIGPQDPDFPGIAPDDSPIIPEEHASDAPVLKVLERKRENRARRTSTSPGTALPRPGANAPCPCGSGKKFKRCHGALR